MKDKLYLDLYHVEHPQEEHLADDFHLADLAEHKHWHFSLGLSPLEQFIILACIALALVMLLSTIYGASRF